VNIEKANTESLKKFTSELGVSLLGVADITDARNEFNLDVKLRNNFVRGISLGQRLVRSVLEEIVDKPTPLYFHLYRQVNFFLDRSAFLLSSRIQDSGYNALPIPASQIVNWERQQGHLSHKKIGYLAGLGWIGRNNLLVNPELGSQFRMVTVLTDMPLLPNKPLNSDCGECVLCLSTCPAAAIKETQEDFDHQACFEKLKEFRRSGVVSQFICGVCVKACRGFSKGKPGSTPFTPSGRI
jgi:epoxyqueuosine reductase